MRRKQCLRLAFSRLWHKNIGVIKGKCYFCGSEVELTDKVFQKDTCENCKRDLHSCVQCKFYDIHASNQCREPLTDFIRDKEKRNICGYFEFADSGGGAGAVEDAKKKLEDLFKKK